MAPLNTLSLDCLPSLHRQRLFSDFASLRQACPEGVFATLTPGDPTLWSAALFVRHGPYAQAVLRFQISFPDAYPKLPPLVTFSTDMFHPLISPLTTYMYTTDIQDNGTVSARDDERLRPGGFSLRHGFPQWFGRGRRAQSGSRQVSGEQPRGPALAQISRAPSSAGSPASDTEGLSSQAARQDLSVYHILKYIQSTFDSEDILDSVPLEAAGNPGAWHAWRTHRRSSSDADSGHPPAQAPPAATRQSGEWNWEGVWEDRVRKGIAASLSDPALFGGGGPDELIRFLAMEDSDVASIKDGICREFDNAS
ncbi:hypothetical protein G6O67_000762 [Ophiocordyceps sinensis]|uniref:UBC core domain-containing protein n=1 Tax=Ophiocordyceps sinensis TaxID=72228 RepID=A0A8H4V9Z1_9HYPO|nr:hypothetical protein G6O67_000762 [Ophiocordyceps sinensis]